MRNIVSYKKENQKIVIDAEQENEEETKPQKLAGRKNGNRQRQQEQKRNILVVDDSMLTGIFGKSLSKKHKKHNILMTSFSDAIS